MKENELKIYKEGYLKSSKRIYASLLDSLILVVVTFLLLFVTNQIVKNTSSYKEKISGLRSYQTEIYRLIDETNLYVFNEDDNGNKDYENRLSQVDIYKRYALSNVLHSYNTFKEDWDKTYPNEEEILLNLKDKYKITEASYETDYLAYFFVTYAKSHNENNELFILKNAETYESHYVSLIKNNADKVEWEYFENDALPALKITFAHNLYKYIENSDTSTDAKNAYDYLMNSYVSIFKNASSCLTNSKAYQDLYVEYSKCYKDLSMIIDGFCIIDYVIGYLLAFVLPVIVLKKGRTIGLLAFGGALINKERLEASSKENVIYLVSKFFSFFPIMFFSCFFAGGINSGWLYPVFYIGRFGVSLFSFTIIMFIFPLIDLFMTLLKSNKQDLALLISNTVIIDIKYFVNNKDEKQVMDDKNKNESQVNEDKPYFDSTTFNNSERNEDLMKKEDKKENKE